LNQLRLRGEEQGLSRKGNAKKGEKGFTASWLKTEKGDGISWLFKKKKKATNRGVFPQEKKKEEERRENKNGHRPKEAVGWGELGKRGGSAGCWGLEGENDWKKPSLKGKMEYLKLLPQRR